MEPRRRHRFTALTAVAFVFFIAVAVRIPSCYESFWIDELHSAWTVWGSLSDVGVRAHAGHQSPVYFVGLWFWKQLIGDSEVALRFSSVLATGIGCAILTAAVAGWTGNVVAGLTSGLVLAIERNAIFFGTELRPYAWVILLASVSLACFLKLSTQRSRFESSGLWSMLILSILLSALLQPTSIGVLILFPLALLLRWSVHDPRAITRLGTVDALLLIATIATLFTLWRITLGESWRERSQWAAFGTATNLSQIVEAWDWIWLLLVPLSVAIAIRLLSYSSESSDRIGEFSGTLMALSWISVVGTLVYWWVSWMDWAPIWHRRYFIAALPVFAVLAGGAIGIVGIWALDRGWKLRGCGAVTAMLASLVVLGLGLHQRTIQALRHYPVALAVRGEDWRGAVAWVNENASDSDQLYLDPDLIESKALFQVLVAAARMDGGQAVEAAPPTARAGYDYLLFAVRGPYAVDRHIALCSLDTELTTPPDSLGFTTLAAIGTSSGQPSGRSVILGRRPARRVEANVKKRGGTVIRFGGVSVLVRSPEPEREPDQGH